MFVIDEVFPGGLSNFHPDAIECLLKLPRLIPVKLNEVGKGVLFCCDYSTRWITVNYTTDTDVF